MSFNIGEIEGQFDSSLSVGASWSMRSADKDYIGTRNGGHASSQTSDDGRLNFKKGETFSKIFKGIHDLELKYGDTGAFFRGKYWYDFELKDEHRLLYDIDDHNRKEGAKSSGAQLLDAFLYHNYSIGDLPGSVRVGKQVVSWGEHVHPELDQQYQPDGRRRVPPARRGDQGRPDPGEHALPVPGHQRRADRRRLLPVGVGPDGDRQLRHLLLYHRRGRRWLRADGLRRQRLRPEPGQRLPLPAARRRSRCPRQRPVGPGPALVRGGAERHRVRPVRDELPVATRTTV